MSMSNTEKTLKDIGRNPRRKFSTEEKIHIVLDQRAVVKFGTLSRKKVHNLQLAV